MKKNWIVFIFLLAASVQAMPAPLFKWLPSENNQTNVLPLKVLIVIDPGHGGDDFGTHSLTTPKYQEKSLNLATSFMLRDYLQQMGYQVKMTRVKDVFLSLSGRAEMANALSPRLFVSIHYNSAPNAAAEGVEIYYYRSQEDKKRSKESLKLAQSILQKIVVASEAKSRGVKHGNFAVIRETNMPAVLVEGGFLTNPDEMKKIKDAQYVKKLALGIAQGVHAYVSKNGSG